MTVNTHPSQVISSGTWNLDLRVRREFRFTIFSYVIAVSIEVSQAPLVTDF